MHEAKKAKAAKGLSKALFWLVQWTWGLPVNLIGGLMYLVFYPKCRHGRFNNAFISYVPWKFGGLSLGQFIFMADHGREPWTSNTRIHEYGHTIQCLLLGPLYWFVIGVPSAVWCHLFTTRATTTSTARNGPISGAKNGAGSNGKTTTKSERRYESGERRAF